MIKYICNFSDIDASDEEEREPGVLSSYSSYNDFLSDIVDNDIASETFKPNDDREPTEIEKLSVDLEQVFCAATSHLHEKDDLSLLSNSSFDEGSVKEDNENTSSDQVSFNCFKLHCIDKHKSENLFR